MRVSAQEMRERFNASDLLSRIQDGTVVAVETDRSIPAPSAQQPPGTVSLQYSYRDAATGEELARVHQYTKPDGTLGGSGKPDPKRLLLGGVLYRLYKGGVTR